MGSNPPHLTVAVVVATVDVIAGRCTPADLDGCSVVERSGASRAAE
jgi:hypothetical protein